MISQSDIIVDPPEEVCVVDPMAWFDTPGPFEIEIGCGKGGFLLHRIQSLPDRRLLGIEWANKYFRLCADRMARRGIRHVRVMRTDAGVFVARHLPPRCVSLLHLYHPDPWPKHRHHKRRIVQPAFVNALIRVLTCDGGWLIQTDHAEYFEHIREVVGAFPQLRPLSWEEASSRWSLDQPATNFEIKYRREGRPIYRVAYASAP